jgi:dTDP-4-amino-4,6-dideoxygalactose transaminase
VKIPFVDLSRQFRALEIELSRAFLDVGNSGIYIMGDRLEAFEHHIAQYCGVAHAIGVGNGSDALFLILKALGIGPGDEVITATNSFIASAWTIAATGAKPVLVDVLDDFNIDPDGIESALTSRTKAIIPVHLAGRPAQMDEINTIAQKFNLFVVEDAAQAIGARYRGQRTGSLSIAAGFSLHPLKNLGVYGDGGLITTSDTDLAQKLRRLRNHGLRNRDECESWGYNSRLDPMQAAFADVKLAHLDSWNQRCRDIADTYRTELSALIKVPVDQPWEECVYHNFVIRTERRDELMAFLQTKDIDTRIHYPIPIHLQKAAKELKYKQGDFPKAENFANSMLSLPIYPELTNSEVQYVIDSILSFFDGRHLSS